VIDEAARRCHRVTEDVVGESRQDLVRCRQSRPLENASRTKATFIRTAATYQIAISTSTVTMTGACRTIAECSLGAADLGK
jgi:hypothetical protein